MNIKRYFYSFWQKIIEMKYGIQTNDSKVFMFHQVTDDKNAWRDENCAITLTGFENFLERIKRQNVVIASIEKLEEDIRKKRIYITFDDVYEDAVCNAFPILIKEGIPFCIFVSTELMGQSDYITKEQLQMLAKEPLCTIGFHSKSHTLLRLLSKEESKREMDKQPLEAIIEKKIEYFAYPYGSYYAVARKDIQLINSETYKMAFSTIKISVNTRVLHDFEGFIPRININEKNYEEYI